MKMVPCGGLEPPSLTATRLKLVVFAISPTRVLKIQINDSGWNCTNSTFASFISAASIMPYLLYLEKQTRVNGMTVV